MTGRRPVGASCKTSGRSPAQRPADGDPGSNPHQGYSLKDDAVNIPEAPESSNDT